MQNDGPFRVAQLLWNFVVVLVIIVFVIPASQPASQYAAAPFGNFDGSNLQVVLLRLRLCRARLLHYYGILQLLTTYNEREL